jgi:hypothetical protein
MSATRCTCILDDRLQQVVVDPTCPAARLHLLQHADGAARRPGR